MIDILEHDKARCRVCGEVIECVPPVIESHMQEHRPSEVESAALDAHE